MGSNRGSVLLKALLVFGTVSVGLYVGVCSASITRTARCLAEGSDNAKTLTCSVTVGTSKGSLIVSTSNGTARTVSSITWTGCTFTAADVSKSDGTRVAEIWSCHNATAGTNTITLTLSGNSTSRNMMVSEFDGSNGALTLGTTATGSGASTSSPAQSSASITCNPNASADCGWMELTRSTAGQTCSVPTQTGQAATLQHATECYEIDSTNTSQTLATTFSGTASWVMVGANYKEPAGAGPIPNRIISIIQQSVNRAATWVMMLTDQMQPAAFLPRQRSPIASVRDWIRRKRREAEAHRELGKDALERIIAEQERITLAERIWLA